VNLLSSDAMYKAFGERTLFQRPTAGPTSVSLRLAAC
jgi:hypothetical protein